MAMGTRKQRERQEPLWYQGELPEAPGHPFYIDSERGIAWRVADSLTLRQFLHIGLDEPTPDHVTVSTNSAADQRGGAPASVRLGTEAVSARRPDEGQDYHAAMKSIVRRDTQESYTD